MVLKDFGLVWRGGCRARWETGTQHDCWHLVPASREPPLQPPWPQAPAQHPLVTMAEHKAGFTHTRHKPPHETKTTAGVSERHLSATPVSTSTSLHHASSSLQRDDPLVQDTCIEHKGLMFAGDAVQSSRAALGSPGPGIWLLGECFCSTCNFTHHCIGLVILLLEPCFAMEESLCLGTKIQLDFLHGLPTLNFKLHTQKN